MTCLDGIVFTSSRKVEQEAQGVGIAPLGQMLSARELLRRQEVCYSQVQQLAKNLTDETMAPMEIEDRLPTLPGDIAEEVELQVKYEMYVRKQEQTVRRTSRMEEQRIPDGINYSDIQHMRTQAKQKLSIALPRTVGQASRVEGVTPSDIAILMVYLEKRRVQSSV